MVVESFFIVVVAVVIVKIKIEKNNTTSRFTARYTNNSR